jgi:hypothetical protein
MPRRTTTDGSVVDNPAQHRFEMPVADALAVAY